MDTIKAVFGTDYRIGSSSNLLCKFINNHIVKRKLNLRIKDIASGTSQDWAYGVAKISHSYTIELRPDINDIYTGFLLDESYVLEVGEEMYQGILTLMKTLKK